VNDPATSLQSAAWVGQAIERREDAALLTGAGRYADDLGTRPGTLYAAFLRSPHAHARIQSIDTSRALAHGKVRCVLTGEDVRAWAKPFVVGVKQPMEHWCLAVDKVRYAGEPVAIVVAEDRYIAEDALELIDVEYEPLDAVIDTEAATSQSAPVLHEAVGSNVVSDRSFNYGDPDSAFSQAHRRVQLKVHYPRNSCTPIETYVVVAEYGSENDYDVLSNFMGPFSLHAVMALALKVPAAKLRLRTPRDGGGSFGVKQGAFPYIVALCLAARKAGAPVKWVEDRLEHLLAATSSTGRTSTIEAAVDTNGRISALAYDQMDDCGAYLRAPEPATFYRMHGILTGAYRIANLKVRNRVVLTNKTPAGLVRGFGGPQVYFALERLMQRIAAELGIDPLEVYRRNFIHAADFPYRAAAGALVDSGDYHAAMALAGERGNLTELLNKRDAARSEGRLYGIGYAAIVEPSISNMGYITTVMTREARAKAGPKNGAITSVTVSIDLLGAVTVGVASAPHGQGHITVLSQVVADVFGLSPNDITVDVELDTRKDAWSVAEGNYSSRFAGAVAGTAHLAATRLRDKLARIAATQLRCETSEVTFSDGAVHDRSAPEKSLPFARLASSPHWAPGLLPEGMSPGLHETAVWTPPQLEAPDENDRINTSAAYGFAFDICALEIDRDTGQVRIDRYVTAHDAGTLLNPALADGQIRGGFAQGVGAALMEEFAYRGDGSFESGTFADYLVPTAVEIPEPVIAHMETPSPFTPLGAKGIGEGNNMSTPVCIANALADALGPEVDPEAIILPMTPSRLIELIAPAETRPQEPAPQTKLGQQFTAAGSITIAASPQAIHDALHDPRKLASIIPGCRNLQSVADGQYVADMSLSVGLVKIAFHVDMSVIDEQPPRQMRLSGKGSGALGSATGDGRITLTERDNGTQLDYDYVFSLTGKIMSVGARMIERATGMVLQQLFERLGRVAGGSAPGPSLWQRLLRLLGRPSKPTGTGQ
jgi:2-furoyl-CoA dehydrogenase large subunit